LNFSYREILKQWLKFYLIYYLIVRFTLSFSENYLFSKNIYLTFYKTFPNYIPLMLFAYQIHKHPFKFLDLLVKFMAPVSSSLFLIIFWDDINFYWSPIAVVEYSIAFLLIFLLYQYKVDGNANFSFLCAVLSISAIGTIYELPVMLANYPHIDLFSPLSLNFPFYVRTSFISLFLLFYLLKNYNFKKEKIFFAFSIYFMFSIIYFLYPYGVIPTPIPRIPAIILFLSIPYSIKNRKKVKK